MKKRNCISIFSILFVMFVLMPVVIIGGCVYVFSTDRVIASLPGYESKVFYTSGGFQDFTDYAKYTFDSIEVQDLESSAYFYTLTADDVKETLLYIENFEKWVKACGDELEQNYDFDKSIISEGDFVHIRNKNKNDETSRKFDNYDVYFFDIQGQILYHFHNNI